MPGPTGMTIGERKRRLASAFGRTHNDLPVDVRKDIRVLVREDADSYFVIEERRGGTSITVSDVFLDAPDDVQSTLALVVLSKVYGVPHMPGLWAKVKEYLALKETTERSRAAFLKRSKQVLPSPLGECHDLRSSLRRVKERYFDPEGGLGFDDPAVVWSRRRSHKRFGYWMEDYDVIVVNRVLDSPKVPEKVVDYIVYHELLHKRHGHLNLAGHSEAHYHDFNMDERRFEGHDEVEDYLEKIYKTRGECLR